MSDLLTDAEVLLGEMAMTALALLEIIRDRPDIARDAQTLNVSIMLSKQVDRAAAMIRETKMREEYLRN